MPKFLHPCHHAGPAARPDSAQVLMRVHRRVVNADFVVEVRPSAAAARSYVADDVAAMNGFTFSGCISGHVSEEGGGAMAVIDDDRAAIAVDIVSRSDSAI